MTRRPPLAALMLLVFVAPAVHAVDLVITGSPYFESGLFADRVIAPQGERLTITARAAVQGTLDRTVPASVIIRGRKGRVVARREVILEPGDGVAEGTTRWTPTRNGILRLEAIIDPHNEIPEENESNNVASLELPVVIAGRMPAFPWFSERPYLRWANIWAGGINHENIERWRERGVMPLAWKWGGCNMPGNPTEEDFFKHYSDAGDCPGIAIDEFGYYPLAKQIARNETALRGLLRAKQAHPENYVLAWHSGAFYPEQAALYRNAADLVVLESYCFYWAPKGLQTDNAYAFLDMKMRAAREVDLLTASGTPGAKCVTSVDLRPETFNRGELEQVIRHLRRRWPEMRGFGIFGGLISKDATEAQRAKGTADEQFVDRLCFEYFVGPVVTLMPQSLWVTREDDGSFALTVAVSNIGGMDSGPVRVVLLDEGRRIGSFEAAKVPAGDDRRTDRILMRHPWTPSAGLHHLIARIERADGAKVLDAEVECEYFVDSDR